MSLLDYGRITNTLNFNEQEYNEKYSLKVPLYYLSFSDIKGENLHIRRSSATNADMQSIYRKMKSLQKKYPFVSWFLVLSTHSSRCNKRFKINGRGHPKSRIVGDKTNAHFHIGAIGESYNKSAHQYIEELATFIRKKRRHLGKVEVRSYKKNTINGTHFIGYCYRQADEMLTGGDFNWKNYYRKLIDEKLAF